MKYVSLGFVFMLAMMALAPGAGAVVCARGAYHAGCVGAGGAAVVGRSGVVGRAAVVRRPVAAVRVRR